MMGRWLSAERRFTTRIYSSIRPAHRAMRLQYHRFVVHHDFVRIVSKLMIAPAKGNIGESTNAMNRKSIKKACNEK